jgi:phenylalanyl-tRNA synthetase alpha chain
MSHELDREIEGVKRDFAEELDTIRSHAELTALRDRFLSRKKGSVTALMARLKEVSPAAKPLVGKVINELKVLIETGLSECEKTLTVPIEQYEDFTLPTPGPAIGRVHLLSQIRTRIEDIFLRMGCEIAEGPEIESEYNNFTALNIPEYHPVRDEHDTFFIDNHPGLILRTHTSPVQIRYMQSHRPPIKIISPGKTFRKDEPDATHTPVFQQVECLMVDHGITFSNLKGTIDRFIRALFGSTVQTRFRPSFFPFTEPSAEVDMSCFLCQGTDPVCKVCKGTGWLEILGSGMVHPQVLKNCNIDPELYSGFAFGMGIERIAMLSYGVPDLRYLYDNDLRLLQQFG